MTPEEFAELIVSGDAEKIIESVAPLSESQRRELSKTATRIWSQFRDCENRKHDVPPKMPVLARLWKRLGDRYQPNRNACCLAVLAVCSYSGFLRVLEEWIQIPTDMFVRIIADRRPEWIDRWVKNCVESRHRPLKGDLLRAIVRQGLCTKPTLDAYIRWMADVLAWPQDDDPRVLSQVLLDDPEAIRDVWRLFEVENSALARVTDDYVPDDGTENWTRALLKLSQQGHLDRQRLLDASLKALSTGFKDYLLTGYIRFHDRLQPSIEETASRQRTFLDLLTNPSSHVVTFALEKITKIEKAGKLDGELFLNAMPPVFHLRSKGQSKTALQIAARLVQDRPELLPHAVGGVLEAFSHPAADVQKQAVCLIEAWLSRLHPDHATTIRERLEELAPSVRPRAEKLAEQLRPADAAPTEDTSDDGDFESRLAEATREAETLTSPWRERAGVDEALEALRTGRMPRPLEFHLSEARVLTSVAPIVPINNVDDLLDAVARAIESVESADELERILDGISRLCDQRPSDFQHRCDPLAKRMNDIDATDDMRLILPWDTASGSLHRLFMVWFNGEVPGSAHIPVALYKFFDGRLEELIQSVQAGLARPLLAAPTHQGGWIDPIVFVERLRQLFRNGNEPGCFDLIQALLRLAPDDRPKALAAATELPGHVGRVVRWALGGQERPNRDDSSHTALWLAAGRARCPTGALDELPMLKIASDQPDAPLPACYAWKSMQSHRANSASRWQFDFFPIEITLQPAVPSDGIARTWPTVALHQQRNEQWKSIPAWQHVLLPAWQIDMIAQIWPQCTDSFLVAGVQALGQRLDMPSSTLAPNHVYLRPLFEPDRPWTELGVLTVCLGLISKDAGSRTTALDVLIQAILDGRARPGQMSDVLVRMMPGEWVKLNRVADALAEVARLSCAHAWFVAETLQEFVTNLSEFPRDIHFIFSLLSELLIDLGMSLAPETRQRLEVIQGTSKTAKAAAALRKLEATPRSVKLRSAGLELLIARIARAKRWADGLSPGRCPGVGE
jgi:hypothetical protein